MNLPEIQANDQIWRSLEIATMVLAVLSPVVIVILAIRFKRILKKLNQKQWTNQKIVEKRMEFYDRFIPKLNDIYCFFCYVGNWNELSPPQILRSKKELDKDLNIYASLFSDDLSNRYLEFMRLCFVSRSGWEQDEKIKSLFELRQGQQGEWSDEWIQLFDTNNVVEATKIKESYDLLLESFKKDLVVFQSGMYSEASES